MARVNKRAAAGGITMGGSGSNASVNVYEGKFVVSSISTSCETHYVATLASWLLASTRKDKCCP